MSILDVKVEELEESLEVKEYSSVLKMKLNAEVLKATEYMSSEDILKITKIYKSDLSKLRSMNLENFSIECLITILDNLGFRVTLTVKSNEIL